MKDEDSLARMLGQLPEQDPWRVECVLKESPLEVTQVVYLRGAPEAGPFVRKVMRCAPGVGEVWRRLFACQRKGLRSRQLPRLLSCAERDGKLEVVMEYVPGPTLRERVLATPSEGRPELAAGIVASLCAATTELNEGMGAPVIHRDITPSNVICSGLDGNTAVLVDLGIARTWHEGQRSDTTHFGTRAYAPPEQFGFGQTDLRCDVYALGMCALFCLTGRDPVPEDRQAGFAVPGVPVAWQGVIGKACAFDPDARYASAREMGQDVARLVERKDAPVGDRRPSQTGRRTARDVLLVVWRSRNIVIVPVMALLVTVCISLVFDPKALYRGNPWLNAFGYLVYMDYLVLAVGYLLMDKRWLRVHVPYLRRHTTAQVARLLVGVFVALTTVLCVLSVILKA